MSEEQIVENLMSKRRSTPRSSRLPTSAEAANNRLSKIPEGGDVPGEEEEEVEEEEVGEAIGEEVEEEEEKEVLAELALGIEEEFDQVLDARVNPYEVAQAKGFLQKVGYKAGISLYDHLNEVIKKILSERPPHVIDYFEQYSHEITEERLRPSGDYLQDIYMPPHTLAISKQIKEIFNKVQTQEEEEENVDDEEGEGLPKRLNIMEAQYYFEQVGVQLPRQELFAVVLAIKILSQNPIISKVRFWGKILGTDKNYLVAEAELTEEEIAHRLELIAEAAQAELEREEAAREAAEAQEQVQPEEELKRAESKPATRLTRLVTQVGEATEGEEVEEEEEAVEEEEDEGFEKLYLEPLVIPEPPKSTYKPPVETAIEDIGVGVNKKVYYVCNSPGDEWVELPDVTPKQITTARKTRKFFTGDLEKEIITFPPFPGKEMNYLRAQIARISAGTQISPEGYFKFEGEEEEEEEGEVRAVTENPEYTSVPMRDLLDGSMTFWVHHTPHILRQGRTTFWKAPPEGGEEEVEEEEEKEEEEVVKEVGPPLLTPLAEDATIETVPPWLVQTSSVLLPDSSIAVVISNLWPGAYTFSDGRRFENIYVGFGHKYTSNNYTPPPYEQPKEEYPVGPEIMEVTDPTPEDEEAYRLRHMPKEEQAEEEEEEEGEDDEEEED